MKTKADIKVRSVKGANVFRVQLIRQPAKECDYDCTDMRTELKAAETFARAEFGNSANVRLVGHNLYQVFFCDLREPRIPTSASSASLR